MTDKKANVDYEVISDDRQSQLIEFYKEQLETGDLVEKIYQWRNSNKGASGGNITHVAKLGDKIVGTINAVPTKFTFNGQSLNATWQTDAVVSPEMRGRFIGKRLLQSSEAPYDLIMQKGVSDIMYRMTKNKKIGFVDGANTNYLIRVLRPDKVPGIKKKIAFFGIWFLSLFKIKGQKPSGLVVNEIDVFDDKFDQLAGKLSQHKEVRIYKDSRYLNWRYKNNPVRSYVVLKAEDAQGVLRGAIVFRNNATPGARAWITDILCEPQDQECIAVLLGYVTRLLTKNKAGSVWMFLTSNALRKTFFQYGFSEIQRTPNFTYHLRHNPMQIDFAAVEWNIVSGDSDDELYYE